MDVVEARPAAFPAALIAEGSANAPFEALLRVGELPRGEMRRVTRADLDVLLAHTPDGVVAVAIAVRTCRHPCRSGSSRTAS